jgi:hypothetical protein
MSSGHTFEVCCLRGIIIGKYAVTGKEGWISDSGKAQLQYRASCRKMFPLFIYRPQSGNLTSRVALALQWVMDGPFRFKLGAYFPPVADRTPCSDHDGSRLLLFRDSSLTARSVSYTDTYNRIDALSFSREQMSSAPSLIKQFHLGVTS